MYEATVDVEEFRTAIAPTAAAVRSLASFVVARYGQSPAVPSEGIAEIGAEAKFASSDWASPVMDAHSFGDTTLFAVADYGSGFAHAIEADPTPVFAHLVQARAALEISTVAAWLNEPGIDPAERIKRALCEQLYSAIELVRLGLDPDASERVKRWKETATGLGWEVQERGNKPRVGGAGRPSVPVGIDQLMLGEASRIGRTQWSYLSSVSHGTWYGLSGSFVARDDAASGIPGTARVAIGTNSSSINMQAVCVLRCLRKAAEARYRLMRLDDDEWRAAARAAEGYEITLIRQAAAAGLVEA